MTLAGVDTGGTFTDFAADDGRRLKIPSTPRDPLEAVASGLAALGIRRGDTVTHGTTVATNALLTGAHGKAGLLITRGFRDLLVLGRQNRPDLYDPAPRRRLPPVDDDLVFEIDERLDAGGSVLRPLDGAAVSRAAERLHRAGAGAVAVCFLHSWRNPGHERAAGRVLARHGVPATLSSDLAPEFREYERFATAAANAALLPLFRTYARSFLRRFPGVRIRILGSHGGASDLAAASEAPVRLVLSGPAGGLIAAGRAGLREGIPRLVTLDIGGTSADVAVVEGGVLPRVPSCAVGGLPLRVPALGVHSVGAGGGSIARVDRGGALSVGPESAGADPGPAAAGRGGPFTVTDAQLLLNRIPPDVGLGGGEPLDRRAAERAGREVARALGVGLRELAAAVIRLADAAMERAIRRVTLEDGVDPRPFTLCAFGGAGPLHAAALARALGMRSVLVPLDPGCLSAVGMMEAPAVRELARTVALPAIPADRARRRLAADLVEDGLAAMASEGFRRREVKLGLHLDLRYRGQSHEIAVPDSADPEARFHEVHEVRHGFSLRGTPVELVAVRVRLSGPVRPVVRAPARPTRRPAPPTPVDHVPVVFDRPRRTPVHRRSGLSPGQSFSGPAVVLDDTATILVPPGARASVLGGGSLGIEVAP